MTKRLIGIGLAVMTTLLALVVFWQFRVVVIYVIISVTLGSSIAPISQSFDWAQCDGAHRLDPAVSGGAGWFRLRYFPDR